VRQGVYGSSMYGPSVAALGPRAGKRSSSGDVGKKPLTRAERLANMRASVARYKKQADAQKKKKIVIKAGPYTKVLPGDTPAVQVRRHRMNLATQARIHKRATAPVSTKGGPRAVAARLAAREADKRALKATGAERQKLLKQGRTGRKRAIAEAAKARRRVGFLKSVSRGLKRGVKKYGSTALRVAATGASFVPGVGSGLAAGLGTAAALAEGQRLDKALAAGALSAIPGGQLGQSAITTGLAVARGDNIERAIIRAGRGLARGYGGPAGEAAYQAARAVAGGQRLDRAIVQQATRVVPGGSLGRTGLQTALAISRGKPVGRAIARGATQAAQSYAGRQLRGAAVPYFPRSTRLTAALRSPDPLRGAKLGPVGRPGAFGGVATRLAARAIQRRPVLGTKSSYELARSLGVPATSALAALRKARALRWRPLRSGAARMVGRYASMYPKRFLSRGDTQGLSPDGATWTIEPGDTLYRIAQKLVKDGGRWREIVAANPNVPKHKDWGLRVYAGDVIVIPADWRPKTAPEPSEVTAAEVLKSKATLKAWSVTDGAQQPGVTNYGTKPEDLSTSWGPRDSLMLTSFSGWRGKGLPTDGELSQAHVDELARWAEERSGVKVALPVPSPVVRPETPTDKPGPKPAEPVVITFPPDVITGKPPTPALPPAGGWTPPPVEAPPWTKTPPVQTKPPPTKDPIITKPPVPIAPVAPTAPKKPGGGAGLVAASLAALAFLM